MISNRGVIDPLVDQNYHITRTSQSQKIIVDTMSTGASKPWEFHYSYVLNITNSTKPIESMNLPSPTYIKTSAKINKLSGHTLIISDSHNIGDICATKVILLNSTVKNILADDIFMYYSFVKGDIYVQKNLDMVLAPPPSGIESPASHNSVDKTTGKVRLNNQGILDIIVKAGTISNPEFTVRGSAKITYRT